MNTYTILKNERGPFVVLDTSHPIYKVYEKVGTIKANSLIEAFYKVNQPLVSKE